VPTTFASLGLDAMSPDEKLEIVGQLWDDLIDSLLPGDLLTVDKREELQRRSADAIARPDEWVAWEDARTATLRRLVR